MSASDIENLEHQNNLLRKTLERMQTDPGDLPTFGCGDSGCVVKRPEGMRTNGGCGCDERTLRRALQFYKRRDIFLVETIKQLREALREAEGRTVV